jgi:putative oxidoreductase
MGIRALIMVHDLGLLTSRATVGLAMAAHGAQKAFGAFEGPGPENAAKFIGQLGFEPSEQYAMAASYNELVSGLALALGIGGPLAPAGIMAGMLVAATTVHAKNGFFNDKQGVEFPMLYAAAALAFASAGFGALSLDRVFGLDHKLRHPALTAVAVAGGIAGGLLAMAQRKTAETTTSSQA